MQLLAILALVAVLSAVYEKRKSEKDIIRYNKSKHHYGVIVDKKGRYFYENGKKVKKITAVFLSSKDTSGKKDNIPLKKNPDPKKVELKKQLDKSLKKGLITQAEYKRICEKEKVNSYYIKQIRELDEKTFEDKNVIEVYGWSLDPDDRQLAYDMYHTHLKNKEELEKAKAAKTARKQKK